MTRARHPTGSGSTERHVHLPSTSTEANVGRPDDRQQLMLPDGTKFAVVEAASSSGDERIVLEITMAPGAMAPPRHFHPAQEESWTVLQGELAVQVDNDWHSIAAGESLSIPPGTVHTLGNRSNDTVRFHDTHVPALDFQQYIEDLDRLAASGRLTSRMTPRTLIYGSMALTDHRPMQLSASPVQRAIESLLATLGRTLGYRLALRPPRAGDSQARGEGGGR
jgi:quercetin dioxygenase-like cupin family protein